MTKPKTDYIAITRATTEAEHREQVAEKDRLIKRYVSTLKAVERERDVALELRQHKAVASPIAPAHQDESEATAFAIAGDWHVEETVDPRTVNGLNEYSLEIADRRISQFFRSVLRLTEIERAGTKVENLVLALLGDMMTGYIHEELQESNGLSPTETVLWLRQRIKGGLELLKRDGGFKRILVTCSYGNHGRTTKKPRHATGAKNSYEWMMYHMLRDDVPGIEWMIADGYHLFFEVYGRLIRQHHGDNVQYQGGVGGLTIPTEKAIAGWNKARTPYLDIFGHHHTAQQNPRWICNGSLIGYGAYSIAIKAGFEPPQQTFFLLDSKRGRTATWPIFL